MKPLLLVVVGLAFALATAGGPKTGKLVGHVEIWPLSPLERPGQKPKIPPGIYKPYTVLITQPGPHNGRMKSHLQRVVAQVKLSAAGNYSINLAPGEYYVSINSDQPMMHPPTRQTVKVTAGKTVRADFKIDTGIR